MEFNNLPEELIVIIFGYLKTKDLLNLALVCRNFNFAINNNWCLVRKFHVVLNHRKVDSKWIGSRKYENFKIIGCNRREFERYVGVFSKYGHHVKYLTLETNTFGLNSLKVLFVLCPFINRVAMRWNNIDQSIDFPFALRFLNALDIEGESLSIEKFRMSTQISTLILSGNQKYPQIFTERFMGMQRRLTKLRLIDFNSNAFLYSSPHLHNSVHFRLECLSLVNVTLPNNPRLFRNFLSHHMNSLNYLEIGNSLDVLHYFTKFKNLKTVKLTSIYERDSVLFHDLGNMPMEQVENLYIDCLNMTNIYIKFPNVINLEICRVKINPAEILPLKFLESLTIIESKNIPSLTTLNVRNIKFISCFFTSRKVLRNNRRFIEKLSIINCKNIKWLEDFMEYEYLNLKRFELTGTKITKKLYNKIMSMERKMEKCIVPSSQVMTKFQNFKHKVENCLDHLAIFITCFCDSPVY